MGFCLFERVTILNPITEQACVTFDTYHFSSSQEYRT